MVDERVRSEPNGGSYTPLGSYWPIATAMSILAIVALIGLPEPSSRTGKKNPAPRSLEERTSLPLVQDHSLNYTPGRTEDIRQILLHAAQGDEYSARSLLKDPASKRSVHYFVTDAGTIYELVDPKNTAWGAGPENPCSISVMAEGVGGLTSAQGTSLHLLVDELRSKHGKLPVRAYDRVANPIPDDITSSLGR